MRTTSLGTRIVTCALLCACSVSCTHWRIGHKLNAVGEYLDEYGTVSVSSPLLADVSSELFKERADNFKFQLTDGPDQYFEYARNEIQGQVGTSSQTGLDSRTGIQVRANLEDLLTNRIRLDRFREDEGRFRRRQSINDAAGVLGLIMPLIDPKFGVAQVVDDATGGDDQTPQDGADQGTVGDVAEQRKLTPEEERTARFNGLIEALGSNAATFGPEQRPDIPEFTHNPPTIDPDLLPKNELAEQLFADARFSKFLALLNSRPVNPTKNPVRPAIIGAAGDQMVEAIMTFLGGPELAVGDWNDKAVLMGVSMVSVAPGTRTDRGYVADVAVTCRYVYRPVRPSLLARMLKSKNAYLRQLLVATSRETAEAPEFTRVCAPLIEKRSNFKVQEANLRGLTGGADPWQSAYTPSEDDKIQITLSPKLSSSVEAFKKAWNEYTDEFLPLISGISSGIARPEDLRPDARDTTLYDVVLDPEVLLGEPEKAPRLRKLPRTLVETAPLVSAVSPMTEAQNLDLSSSIRQQQAFALRLAIIVSGFGADAQIDSLLKYVNRLEQDVVTRTPLNTVAGYSNAGGTFGYQIGPDLRGVADFEPTRRKWMLDGLINGAFQPGPDMVLQRQSFPVALFIGLDRADIRPRIMHIYKPTDGASDTDHVHRDECQWLLVEPRLEFAQTVRWIPTRHSKGLPPLAKLLDRRPRVHESDRVAWAYKLDRAAEVMAHSNTLQGQGYRPFREYVRQRIDTLRSQALSASSTQAIPLSVMLTDIKKSAKPTRKKTPKVTVVTPDLLCFEQADDDAKTVKPITIALSGVQLVRIDTSTITIRSSDDAKNWTIDKGKTVAIGGSILVTTESRSAPKSTTTIWFELDIKQAQEGEPESILSPPIQICPPPKPPKKQGDGKPKEIILKETVGPAGTTEPGIEGTVTREITIPFNTPMRLAELFLQSLQRATKGDNQVKIDLDIDASTQIKGASVSNKEASNEDD